MGPSTPRASRRSLLTRAWLGFCFRVRHPSLAGRLAALALLLASPCLLLEFYLDDFVGRYIYSERPGARHLFEAYAGGYGLARGDATDLHWQIENGYAPWWAVDGLRLSLWRPVGVLFHRLDMQLGPLVQHAHSWVWLGLLVWVTTRLYRELLGRAVGGIAALLFALDHTHGFIVGYICNRYALIAAVACVVSLHLHVRARERGRASWAAPALFGVGLLAGECSVALAGYIAAFTLFMDEAPLRRRASAVAGYALVLVSWRVGYSALGFGASGSGLYIDPAREPLHFLGAFLERAPVLILGQFALPPAETYVGVSPLWSRAQLLLAVTFCVALGVALTPLLRRDRGARFWALGMTLALVPAASTYPQNRQLLFASFGALALVAKLWQFHAGALREVASSVSCSLSRAWTYGALFVHVLVSPLLQPFTTCSIALAEPLQRGALESLGDDIAERDVIFVTAPDYFATKLPQLSRRARGAPLPRRWRALGFGPERVTVTRVDEATLDLRYAGGILTHPFLELYRDRRLPMKLGQRVRLEGLNIEVTEVTVDGRLSRARFTFDTSLDSPRFKMFHWGRGEFLPFTPPRIGAARELEPAVLDWNPSRSSPSPATAPRRDSVALDRQRNIESGVSRSNQR